VLVRKAQPERVMAELARFRGRVLRSSLAPEQEARLQAALSGTTTSQALGSPRSSATDTQAAAAPETTI
jgi:uncharacterized membrane protein